jgi:uncharacterized membrane protein YfcA
MLLVRQRVVHPSNPVDGDPADGTITERSLLAVAGMFGVAVYVGYFGAGGGVALLALLAFALPEPLPRVNALKNVVSGFANVAATAVFAVSGPVYWPAVVPLACGFLVGGTTGPAIVRRLPDRVMRWTVAVAGFGLATALAIDAYH